MYFNKRLKIFLSCFLDLKIRSKIWSISRKTWDKMVSNNNYIYTYCFRINLFLLNEMIEKNHNTVLKIVFFLISLSLISAFVIEYGLGHEPCKLCLYQRYPYYLSIVLLTSIFVLKKNVKIHLLSSFHLYYDWCMYCYKPTSDHNCIKLMVASITVLCQCCS